MKTRLIPNKFHWTRQHGRQAGKLYAVYVPAFSCFTPYMRTPLVKYIFWIEMCVQMQVCNAEYFGFLAVCWFSQFGEWGFLLSISFQYLQPKYWLGSEKKVNERKIEGQN